MGQVLTKEYVLTRKSVWILIGLSISGWGLSSLLENATVIHELGQLLAYGASGVLLAPHLSIWESTE